MHALWSARNSILEATTSESFAASFATAFGQLDHNMWGGNVKTPSGDVDFNFYPPAIFFFFLTEIRDG